MSELIESEEALSNQTKKEEEVDALTAFLQYCEKPFAKQLRKCQNISASEQERPDILLANDKTVFGIDHIYLPLCREGDGDADQVQKGREKKTFRKYQIDEENGINKLEGHENEAIGDIEHIVDKKYEAISDFKFDDYIRYCREKMEKHDALAYRENIRFQYPQKECSICLLLDIPYPFFFKTFEYYHLGNHKRACGFRKDYPFTSMFLDVLMKIRGVDKFFLIWHPDRNYKKKETACYILDTSSDLKTQVPIIWWRFDIPVEYKHPRKVKLLLEKSEE